MTYNSPPLSFWFKAELEQSINIQELEGEAIQTEQRLREKLEILLASPEGIIKTYFAELTHLVAEGESEKNFQLKAKNFSQAKNLAWKLAIAFEEASLSELYEICKNYARALSGTQAFFEMIGFMDLAKEAKNNNNLAEELLYRTKAFNSITKISSLEWNQCSINIRQNFYVSAFQLLKSDAFEENSLVSELRLRLKMILPSIKYFKDIVSNYRKAKKEYIKSILLWAEIDPVLFKDIEEKINESSVVNSQVNSEVKQTPASDSWEEESAFINMLIDDMEEARNTESSPEEIEAFEKISRKFIE
jgi:hypothetical protein